MVYWEWRQKEKTISFENELTFCRIKYTWFLQIVYRFNSETRRLLFIYIVWGYDFQSRKNRKNCCYMFSFGIVYLFMIYSFGRNEDTAKSSLPPIKTSDNRQIARSDFGENDSLKGILFLTNICWNIIIFLMFDVRIFSNVLFKIMSQSI